MYIVPSTTSFPYMYISMYLADQILNATLIDFKLIFVYPGCNHNSVIADRKSENKLMLLVEITCYFQLVKIVKIK